MNNSLYRFTGYVLIIVGILLALFGVGVAINETDFFEILFPVLLAFLALILFSLHGRFYLKITRTNKLTQWSVLLIFVGLGLIVLSALITLALCGKNLCDGWGLLIPAYSGVLPAGILYLISLFLLA